MAADGSHFNQTEYCLGSYLDHVVQAAPTYNFSRKQIDLFAFPTPDALQMLSYEHFSFGLGRAIVTKQAEFLPPPMFIWQLIKELVLVFYFFCV